MKNLIFAFSCMLLCSAVAHADAYVCETVDGSLMIQLVHEPSSGLDVRVSSVMTFLSRDKAGNTHEVASFSPLDETLLPSGVEYLVRPTASISDSGAATTSIGGTPLNQLASIDVYVKTGPGNLPNGTVLPAEITLQRLNGTEAQVVLACARSFQAE